MTEYKDARLSIVPPQQRGDWTVPAQVLVNGVDVAPSLRQLWLHIDADEAVATIELEASPAIEFDADTHVFVGDGLSAADFAASIKPAELAAVLSSCPLRVELHDWLHDWLVAQAQARSSS